MGVLVRQRGGTNGRWAGYARVRHDTLCSYVLVAAKGRDVFYRGGSVYELATGRRR